MATLNINKTILAYSDADVGTSNPIRRNVDWAVRQNGIQVNAPQSNAYPLDPGATFSVFSGTRTLSTDGTTQFTLTLNPFITAGTTYRMTWVAGTNPVFRTDRGLTLSSDSVAVTINNNATATFTVGSAVFSAVAVNDTLFIPGLSTGDIAGPFNPLNVGAWVVIGKAAGNTAITCRRPTGQLFSGVAETQTVTSNGQFIVFAPTGVQIGDSLQISAGFSSVSFGTYTVSNVTSKWVEFSSGAQLPLESTIEPGASGITIYSQAKRYVYVESDQPLVVQINGDTGTLQQIQPLAVGDPCKTGWWENWNKIWSLNLINLSGGSPANVVVVTVE